jgi:hypothetical protein
MEEVAEVARPFRRVEAEWAAAVWAEAEWVEAELLAGLIRYSAQVRVRAGARSALRPWRGRAQCSARTEVPSPGQIEDTGSTVTGEAAGTEVGVMVTGVRVSMITPIVITVLTTTDAIEPSGLPHDTARAGGASGSVTDGAWSYG